MSELTERLKAEGENAMRQHLSLGMHKLCAEAAHRIEVLEDAIKYGIGLIQGGFPMEAALEMDRRLADRDFDFQNPGGATE